MADTPSQDYDAAIQELVAGPEAEPRPTPSRSQEAFVNRLLDEIRTCPQYDQAIKRWEVAQADLVPHRQNPGHLAQGKRKTGAQRRQVGSALIYSNLATTVAITVPDKHEVRVRPRRQVKGPMGAVPQVPEQNRRFAETAELVTQSLMEEADAQEIVEAWVQDATAFGLGILRVAWQTDLRQDLPADMRRRDEQDNAARLQYLGEEAAQGRLHSGDPEWVELLTLAQTLGGKQEVRVWSGLDLENVPMWAIRVDPRIRDYEKVYHARWISHALLLSRAEVRQMFPYEVIEQDEETGRVTKWSGVHPLDLGGCSSTYQESSWGVPTRIPDDTYKSMRSQDDYVADNDLLLVWVVYHKQQGRVLCLLDGVPYPIRNLVPERLTDQWYPFVFLQPNRLHGDLYGMGDAELQKEAVDRINTKATQEEHARRNLIGNLFASKNDLEPEDMKVIEQARREPGLMALLNTKSGNKKLSDIISLVNVPYDPMAFDRTEDYQILRQLARVSEQSQGVTGRAKFAAEVQAAAQGTAISAASRQDKYQRALTRVYRMALQLAIWHLRPEEAQRYGGPHAFWPEVVSDEEAVAIMEGFHQQAIAEAAVALAPMVAAQAAETGQFDQAAVFQLVQEQAARLVQAKVVDRFGSAEPLTRESLYRTIDLSVEVSINGMADRQQRIQNAIQVLDVALRAGVLIQGMPLVQLAAEELGLGDALTATGDPNQLFAAATQAAAQNPGAVSPETAQGVLNAAGMVQQATAAQAGGEMQDAQAQATSSE